MESDQNQISQSPTLCRSGCGFYGNAAFDGMCSMCYKDAVKRKQAAPTATPASLVSEQISSFSVNVGGPTSSPVAPSSPTTTTTVPSIVSAITAQTSSTLEAQVEDRHESPKLDSVESPLLPSSPAATVVCSSPIDSVLAPSPMVDSIVDRCDAPKPAKKKKTRCEKCRANVGVISFPCRCGRIFCGTHRYATEHNCTFDYKEHGAEEIRKNNPQIIGEKVQKI